MPQTETDPSAALLVSLFGNDCDATFSHLHLCFVAYGKSCRLQPISAQTQERYLSRQGPALYIFMLAFVDLIANG